MNTRLGLLASAVFIMLATSTAWAKPDNQNGCGPSGGQPQKCVAAPEIEASSGASAIALLTGVVFLISERSRRRGSRRDDERDQDNHDSH